MVSGISLPAVIGNYAGFLIKYNPGGVVQGYSLLDGIGANTYISTLTTDIFGNVYICGNHSNLKTIQIYSIGAIIPSCSLLSNQGTCSSFIIKYDSNGYCLGLSQLNAPGLFANINVINAEKLYGNIYIGGYYNNINSNTNLYSIALSQSTIISTLDTTSNYNVALMIKYNSNGICSGYTLTGGKTTGLNSSITSICSSAIDGSVYTSGYYTIPSGYIHNYLNYSTSITTSIPTLNTIKQSIGVNNTSGILTYSSNSYVLKYNLDGTFASYTQFSSSNTNIYTVLPDPGLGINTNTGISVSTNINGTIVTSICNTKVLIWYYKNYSWSNAIQLSHTIGNPACIAMAGVTSQTSGTIVSGDLTSNFYQGQVIYWTNTAGTWGTYNVLTDPGLGQNAGLGRYVATDLNGQRIVAGAYMYNFNTGAVVTWDYVGSWVPTILPNPNLANSSLGYSVAINPSASIVVAGGYAYNNTGIVVVWVNNAGWSSPTVLSNPNLGTGFLCIGWSVAVIDSKTIVAGATGYNGNSGAVIVWNFDNTKNNWSTPIVLPDPGLGPGVQLGYSVAITGDGSTITAGAPYYNNNTGINIVWKYYNNTWNIVPLPDPGLGTTTNYGIGNSTAIDLYGLFITAGAQSYNSSTGAVITWNYNTSNTSNIQNNTIITNSIVDYYGNLFIAGLYNNTNTIKLNSFGTPGAYTGINLPSINGSSNSTTAAFLIQYMTTGVGIILGSSILNSNNFIFSNPQLTCDISGNLYLSASLYNSISLGQLSQINLRSVYPDQTQNPIFTLSNISGSNNIIVKYNTTSSGQPATCIGCNIYSGYSSYSFLINSINSDNFGNLLISGTNTSKIILTIKSIGKSNYTCTTLPLSFANSAGYLISYPSIRDTYNLIQKGTTSLTYTGTAKTVTLFPGTYTFTVAGAQGGNMSGSIGGNGMVLIITYTLQYPIIIKYVIGGAGGSTGSTLQGAGGGGATYIYNINNSTPLFIAGGGGGGGGNALNTSSPGTGIGGGGGGSSGGGGGGGLYGDGSYSGTTNKTGYSFLVSITPVGSGTSAGGNGPWAGGGTSYAISSANITSQNATNTGNGYITINY